METGSTRIFRQSCYKMSNLH